MKLFLSKDGRDGSMKTQAHTSVYAATLNGDQTITQAQRAGPKVWVQVVDGAVQVNGIALGKGDGLAVEGSGTLRFDQGQDAGFLFLDLGPSIRKMRVVASPPAIICTAAIPIGEPI